MNKNVVLDWPGRKIEFPPGPATGDDCRERQPLIQVALANVETAYHQV